MAGLVAIYRRPADVEAFEKHYFETHIPLAKAMPGFRKYEVSSGPISVLAGPTDVYLIGTVHFDDLEAMQRAFASPEGRATAADRQLYAPDDTGVQIFVFDTREV
ncbi:EthD family reductase [uncultured Phenylobacterium sp.]|uniref:EthD family reductase n=1 Tax=uncultured Phenylobacterium sp. TaxID=349273 RepID=UPI0025F95F2D|nr:EthD family reductase [uncultured Phenylobacterium sp.]